LLFLLSLFHVQNAYTPQLATSHPTKHDRETKGSAQLNNSDDLHHPTSVGGGTEGDERHLKLGQSFTKRMLSTKVLNHSLIHTALATMTNKMF
jgi:hypothetical protein